MTARLWELWRQWSGLAMAERTAYTKGYDEGFRAALNSLASVRGVAFIDGFVEGRESVRTIPLDSSLADEESDGAPCPYCDSQHCDCVERISCPQAGELGHAWCGLCPTCNGPRWQCGHHNRMKSETPCFR